MSGLYEIKPKDHSVNVKEALGQIESHLDEIKTIVILTLNKDGSHRIAHSGGPQADLAYLNAFFNSWTTQGFEMVGP